MERTPGRERDIIRYVVPAQTPDDSPLRKERQLSDTLGLPLCWCGVRVGSWTPIVAFSLYTQTPTLVLLPLLCIATHSADALEN